MTLTSRPALVALATGLVLTLGACGGDAGPAPAAPVGAGSASPSAARPATGEVSAEHGPADVAFVTGMHPHHQGALAMAELAATRAGSEEVRELAARIAAAQGPENARMQAMATAWDLQLPAGGTDGGHGGHGGGGDVAALEGLTGAEFDREFLGRMVAHHESALPMARAELADGQNPQAEALAQEILQTQQAEISEMRELLGRV